jgi:pimeloyl-ACP methyl ester carboxylesterase
MPNASLSAGAVAYRDQGSGEPLLFVHGLLVNGRLWDPVVRLLADGHRCIQPDLPLGSHATPMNPGADLTPEGIAGLVVELMDELGLERVTLVGNDSGGAISQLLAAANPERVGRLVLTNCDMYSTFPPKLFAYFKPMARIPGAFAATTQVLRIKPLRRAPLAFGLLTKSRLDSSLMEEWLTPVTRSAEIRRDARKFILASDPRLTERAARELEGFASPTLFAWAPEDRLFRIENAERLAPAMPDARIVRIPDSRTFVSIDQPERLAREIREFVATTESVAAASSRT